MKSKRDELEFVRVRNCTNTISEPHNIGYSVLRPDLHLRAKFPSRGQYFAWAAVSVVRPVSTGAASDAM